LRDRLMVGDGPKRDLDPFPFSSTSKSPTPRMQHFYQTSHLPDNLFERADRMMMAAAVEGRMPFMDVELADLVASFDESFYASGKGGKRILRSAMSDIVPAAILHRRKVGFRVPIGVWFRTTMRTYVSDLLLDPKAHTASILDRQTIGRTLSEHDNAQKNHESAIRTLINLEGFLRGFQAHTV
jgi:asparagine synthase (glutamine-hydrolysing)